MESISPPDKRGCERCGRVEHWDDTAGTWVAAEVEGTPQRGEAHCVHEWDITAAYNPIEGE